MRWTLEGKIAAGFGLALAVLATSGIIQLGTIQRLVDTDRYVARTQSTLTELAGAYAGIVAVESHGRGYVAMGEQRFMEKIEVSIDDARGHLRALRRLTADSPTQQRYLNQLQPVAERKIAFMLRLIALRRDRGLAAAATLLDTGEGLKQMDEVTRLVETMAAEETAALHLHQSASQSAADEASILSTLGTLLALGIGFAAFWIVHQDLVKRQQMEEEILQLNLELEQRVQQRTAALEAANRELDAFSYTVSHDLRAPLRAIDGFSRILSEEHAPLLNADAQHYLDVVRSSALRMADLIDGLLAFSRLGREALSRQTVSPSLLAEQALEDLRLEQEGRQVQIHIGELPPCEADPRLLRQVFSNLLSNALKYTRSRDVATIEVGAMRLADLEAEGGGTPPRNIANPDSVVYYVRDNGMGFDMRYAGKLFGVFQRLHRAEEFEGTGVGLAIVQRIIHRHDGHVWASAELNKGATFYFTLGEGRTHA